MPSKAPSAATCATAGGEIYRFCARRSIGRTSSGGTISQPIAPARHRIVLGKAVDDDGLALCASAVSRRPGVGQAM